MFKIWRRFISLFRKSRTIRGARAKIFVNGKLVGTFDSVEYAKQMTLTTNPIKVLGKLDVVEIIPEQIQMSVSCTRDTKKEE